VNLHLKMHSNSHFNLKVKNGGKETLGSRPHETLGSQMKGALGPKAQRTRGSRPNDNVDSQGTLIPRVEQPVEQPPS